MLSFKACGHEFEVARIILMYINDLDVNAILTYLQQLFFKILLQPFKRKSNIFVVSCNELHIVNAFKDEKIGFAHVLVGPCGGCEAPSK